MNTETVITSPKGEDYEITIQHDQTGSAYGITISKDAYKQLMRKELIKAFSWVSMIGEQFFDSKKSIEEMVDIYQNK